MAETEMMDSLEGMEILAKMVTQGKMDAQVNINFELSCSRSSLTPYSSVQLAI